MSREIATTCELCGGPMLATAKYGVCKRSAKCKRENARRATSVYRDRNGDAVNTAQRDKRKLARAMRGAVAKNRMRGDKHPRWLGGRVLFCDDCGMCLGYRKPSKISRCNGVNLCTRCHTNRSRKLTEDQAQDVRRRVSGGETRAALAAEYSVDPQTITRIVNHVTYKDIA